MCGQRERIVAFLQLAGEELTAAETLLPSSPRQAAYFCQQCAEKISRAVLTDAGIPFGTGHNLGQVASALPVDHPWVEKIRRLDKHSPAATRYRYPSPTGRLFDPPGGRTLVARCRRAEGLLEEARESLTRAE